MGSEFCFNFEEKLILGLKYQIKWRKFIDKIYWNGQDLLKFIWIEHSLNSNDKGDFAYY